MQIRSQNPLSIQDHCTPSANTILRHHCMLNHVYGILSGAEMFLAIWQSPTVDHSISKSASTITHCHQLWISHYNWVFWSKGDPPDGSKGLAALNADRVTLRGMSEHTMSMRLCMSWMVNAPPRLQLGNIIRWREQGGKGICCAEAAVAASRQAAQGQR